MADIQPEHGTAPIAYELLEAFMRDRFHSLVSRITYWVLRNTYGRRTSKGGERRKTCAYSWRAIALAVDADRSDVSRTGRALLASGRLLLDSRGHIGIQKDTEKWAEVDHIRYRGVGKAHGQKPTRPRHKAHAPRGLYPRILVRARSLNRQS